MRNRTKIIDKALKLKNLLFVENGEKENAQRMLDVWKEKHSITDEELEKSTLSKNSEYAGMNVDDFMKAMQEDIRAIGFSMLIFALGKIFKNENVSNLGKNLVRDIVKQHKEKTKVNNFFHDCRYNKGYITKPKKKRL
jgi:hypothetical protein